MVAHLAVSFPVRRLVARQTDLKKRGELLEPSGKALLRAPMVCLLDPLLVGRPS